MEYGQNLYPTTERYYKGTKLMGRFTIDSAISRISQLEKKKMNIVNSRQKILDQQGRAGRIKQFFTSLIANSEVMVFEPTAHVTVLKDPEPESTPLYDGAIHFQELFASDDNKS